ncbi:MAG: hypothetical protein QNJ64_03870 [Crocosphaera sp.]|nr:hypothetical protein [Crocosphaera sp.]
MGNESQAISGIFLDSNENGLDQLGFRTSSPLDYQAGDTISFSGSILTDVNIDQLDLGNFLTNTSNFLTDSLELNINPLSANLTDGGSSLGFNFDPLASDSIVVNWEVDDSSRDTPVDHLFERSFFYRLNNDTEETSIKTLDLTPGSPLGERILEDVVWQADDFSIEMTWTLDGEEIGNPRSQFVESISIINDSNTTLTDFNFFIYTDLDVGSDFTDDSTEVTILEEFVQSDDVYQVTVVQSALEANDTLYRVDEFPSVIDDLTNNSITDFNNTPTAPFQRNNSDETLGWQFVFDSIGVGESRQITFTTQLAPSPMEPPVDPPSTPEPKTTMALVLLGLSYVGLSKRTSNSKK